MPGARISNARRRDTPRARWAARGGGDAARGGGDAARGGGGARAAAEAAGRGGGDARAAGRSLAAAAAVAVCALAVVPAAAIDAGHTPAGHTPARHTPAGHTPARHTRAGHTPADAVRGAETVAAPPPAALAATLPAAPPTATGGTGSATSRAGHFTPALKLRPHATPAGAPQDDGPVVFDCQRPSARDRTCYGLHQLRAAYGIQPLLDRGITGAGRTIVIVAAYAPPGIEEDLEKFDRAFGLPDPQLRIVAPHGAVWDPRDLSQLAWAGETDADLQWAHAIAPQARIVLVEARSDDDHDLAAAVTYAVERRLGDVISQSFGEDERCTPPATRAKFSAAYRKAAVAGITVVASSGDTGAGQFVCDPNSGNMRKGAAFPASDPRVLAVGGTQLTADLSSGAYHGEVAWNDSGKELASASGGGYSLLFDRPRYQTGAVARKARGVPDVAYSSASNGAVMVYVGQDGNGGKFYGYYGTSVAAPQWSGLVALAAQMAGHRLGWLNPTIYRAAAGQRGGALFHDIRAGNNSVHYIDDSGAPRTVRGYRASPGWDAVTGVGSPIASKLVPLMARAAKR